MYKKYIISIKFFSYIGIYNISTLAGNLYTVAGDKLRRLENGHIIICIVYINYRVQ